MKIHGVVRGLQNDACAFVCGNHITSNFVKSLFCGICGNYINEWRWGSQGVTYHLSGGFQIRLGSGVTRTPAHNLDGLEIEKAVLIGNYKFAYYDFSVASPYIIRRGAEIDANVMLSAFTGLSVLISNIKDPVVDIVSDYPAAPSEGDRYIVNGVLETWTGSVWEPVSVVSPDVVKCLANSRAYVYSLGSWGVIPACTELGLFTYGYSGLNAFKWEISDNVGATYGGTFMLSAYLCANGGSPDFLSTSIDLTRPLIVEWDTVFPL